MLTITCSGTSSTKKPSSAQTSGCSQYPSFHKMDSKTNNNKKTELCLPAIAQPGRPKLNRHTVSPGKLKCLFLNLKKHTSGKTEKRGGKKIKDFKHAVSATTELTQLKQGMPACTHHEGSWGAPHKAFVLVHDVVAGYTFLVPLPILHNLRAAPYALGIAALRPAIKAYAAVGTTVAI